LSGSQRFAIGGQPNAWLPVQIVIVLEQDNGTEKLFTEDAVDSTAWIAKTAKPFLQIANGVTLHTRVQRTVSRRNSDARATHETRFISNTGNTAAPASAENPPKPAKPLQEGKPEIAERVDFLGLGIPSPRPCHTRVNGCIEDAQIQSSGQTVAIHRIPIFVAINVTKLVLFDFTHWTGPLALLTAPGIVLALDNPVHGRSTRIVGVIGIATFPFQGDGKAALEIAGCHEGPPNWTKSRSKPASRLC